MGAFSDLTECARALDVDELLFRQDLKADKDSPYAWQCKARYASGKVFQGAGRSGEEALRHVVGQIQSEKGT